MNRAGLMAACLCVLLTAGCNTAFKTTPDKVNQQDQEAAQQVKQAQLAGEPAGQVRIHNRAYAGGKAILNDHGEPLPATLDRFLLNTKGVGLKLRDIATEIGAQTGLPVDVVDDLPTAGGRPAGGADSECRMAPAYDGQLSRFLDGLGTWCDISWSYRDGRLKLQIFETVSYRLVALPSSSTLKAASTATGSTGGGSSGGGSSGGGSSGGSGGSTASTGQAVEADVSLTSDVKVWEELKSLLSAVAKPGVVEISPGNQTIIVIARHSAQTNVKRLVTEINRRQMRQVVFTVQILNLTTSNELNLGIGLQSLYSQLGNYYNISAGTPTQLTAQGYGQFKLTAKDPQGGTNPWTGSNAVLNALQNLGHVATKDNITVYARDGRPVPVTVARQLGYVSQATSSITTGAAATSVQQSTLTIGLTLELLPVVLDDGQIILQYSFGLSQLNALTNYTSGSVSVEIPDVNVRSTMQEAIVSSGDSLVLMGYEQDQLNQTDQGLPGITDGLFGFLGGSKVVQNGHEALVIIITPQVHENQVSGL